MRVIFRSSCLCAIVSALICGCASPKAEPSLLFSSSDTTGVPYRIPAIAASQDGSVVVVADYRHCRYDIGYGRVDLHGRTSFDNGRTWEGERTVIEGTGVRKAPDCGFGDAAMVCDRGGNEILLISVSGNTVYARPTTNRDNPNRMAALRSTDAGLSWQPYEDITEKVYSLFDPCGDDRVQSCFMSSGRILQSRIVKEGSHYRLYAALCARPHGNRVIFSDDFGHTWNVLGGVDAYPALDGDEAKCEELPDGSVILSSRAWGGRYFNVFRYSDVASGSGTWAEPAYSGEENDGCTAVENACNGEVLSIRARRTADGADVWLLLQSVPLGPDRSNVGIYYKEIPEDVSLLTPESLAASWDGPYAVSDKTSAYSTMVLQSDGTIGFFYEESINAEGSGYDLVYKPLQLGDITSGLYTVGRR
ncbi:MAG: sialidase family protein [Candidatus Cryptobacteroides sp.]